MTGVEKLVIDIHSPELIGPLAEFRETVQEMFAGREGAYCQETTNLNAVPTLRALSPVGGMYRAPFILHGASVSAAIIDEEFETEAQGDLVAVQASHENIVGPGRNEGEMRYRYFQLQYTRQDRLGRVALWRLHKQTFKSEHSKGMGSFELESVRQVRAPLSNSLEIHQYLRGAAHLISVFLDPDRHPKTQLIS